MLSLRSRSRQAALKSRAPRHISPLASSLPPSTQRLPSSLPTHHGVHPSPNPPRPPTAGAGRTLISTDAIRSHAPNSPVEHLALSFEYTSACYGDVELLRVLRGRASNRAVSGALGPSGSAIETSSDAIFFPIVVHNLLPLMHQLPASGYEVLLLLSRFYNSTEAKAANSTVGRQISFLLDHVQRWSEDGDGPSTSAALAQVKFIANAALIDSSDDPRLPALEAEAQQHASSIRLSVLETLLTVSIPRLCKFFIQHTISRIRSAEAYDNVYVLTLWSALLANDYFFNPDHFAAMHESLMLLLHGLPLGASGAGVGAKAGGAASNLVPVMNKTSRVYSLCVQGRRMMEVHFYIFGPTQCPESLRFMPWQYHTRLIGGVFDDVTAEHELAPMGIPFGSEVKAWDCWVVPVAERFLSLFSTDETATTTLWKIFFKSALLFPNAALSHIRSANAYQLFITRGAAQHMSKDQFAQLLRLFCDALASGQSPKGELAAVMAADDEKRLWTEQITAFCNVLTQTPTATMHWGMNAVDALLIALCECPTRAVSSTISDKSTNSEGSTVDVSASGDGSESLTMPANDTSIATKVGLFESTKTALGSHLLSWLTRDFFIAKKVAATDPLNVSTIRKSLETLKVIPASPFWWTCGCTATNTCHTDVCGKCMRNDHARWVCNNPSCLAPQRSQGTVCAHCGTVHPLVQAAENADVPLCDGCVVTPLDEDLLCPKCDIKPSESQQHSATGGFTCSGCGHKHSSKVVCPKCGVKTNPSEPLGMWLCEQCGTYSYLFNKRCTRCASASSFGNARGTKAPQRSTTSFRTNYQPWRCGCGALNSMMRLGCVSCGQNKSYTCASCDRQSSFGPASGKNIVVSTDVCRNVSLPTSRCQHCGDIHPRDAAVLANSSVVTSCYNCGGQCAVGAETCPHCQSSLEGFNALLPFWCELCEEGGKTAQSGFACAVCSAPRPEISHCSYLWRCSSSRCADGPPTADDDDAAACTHWNPSWLSHCESCSQPRVYDAEHEIRSRNCGRWKCSACSGMNPPSQVLICGHCEDGLHIPAPCRDCGRSHIALRCPTEEMLAQAADILDDLEVDV